MMDDETMPASPGPTARRARAHARGEGVPSPLLTRVLLGCLAATLFVQAMKFAGLVTIGSKKELLDFDAFHITARMIGLGRLEDAYHFAKLLPFQREFGGADSFMPWAYPPTFDLVVAPLGLMPVGLSYLVFTGATLAAYLVVLRVLAGGAFGAVVLALYPAIVIALACGQNGFLTASLIGLTCIAAMRGGPAAGLPLGLMAIKPHLAVCLGFFALATRRWSIVACAGITVALFCAAATLAFGPSVWGAFLHGVGEASGFLRQGLYPMYRMVSVYAFLLTIGLPAKAAMAGQWLVAAAILLGLWVAIRRGAPQRHLLAFCALTSPLISPYAYDYDLPICGIGLALVMPEILALSTLRERLGLSALGWIACGWGLSRCALYDLSDDVPEKALSVSGALLPVLILLVWRIVRRERPPAPAGGALPAMTGAAA